jgi:hypothetical protein
VRVRWHSPNHELATSPRHWRGQASSRWGYPHLGRRVSPFAGHDVPRTSYVGESLRPVTFVAEDEVLAFVYVSGRSHMAVAAFKIAENALWERVRLLQCVSYSRRELGT